MISRRPRWLSRVLAILAGCLIGGCLVLLVIALTRVNDTSRSAKALAVQIQYERARSIRSSCEETNARYHNAVAVLDRIIDQTPKGQKAQAKASRERTIIFINALVPLRDCTALVHASVKKP